VQASAVSSVAPEALEASQGWLLKLASLTVSYHESQQGLLGLRSLPYSENNHLLPQFHLRNLDHCLHQTISCEPGSYLPCCHMLLSSNLLGGQSCQCSVVSDDGSPLFS